MLKIGICMEVKSEQKMEQSLHKECPSCEVVTDIGKWAYECPHIPIIAAVCWNCGSPLFPDHEGDVIVFSEPRES